MTSKDYKAVQDLQLRYDTYVQGRRFDLILGQLFSAREDIAVAYSDLQAPAEGRRAVEALYRLAEEKTRENGGFLRTDLCTSQVLEFTPEGNCAAGTWLTIGAVLEGAAFGNAGESMPFYRVMGQRHAQFLLEAGQWKLWKTEWTRICTLGPASYRAEACTGWSGVRERRWELPPEEHCRPWDGRRCR